MSFTYRENRNSPLTWSQLDGNFREVEAVQAEASNQALAAAASAETANQASESASLSSGQAEDYASLAEEMARISVVRWCGNHEEAPSTRLDGSPLQISDEYGNLTDELRYNWTGTSWVALNSSAQYLEQRLSSSEGAGIVVFDPSANYPSNSIGRRLQDLPEVVVDAADRAEAAANLALSLSGIYADTAAGLAATTPDQVFGVPVVNDISSVILYKNQSGVAIDTGARLPSSILVSAMSNGSFPNVGLQWISLPVESGYAWALADKNQRCAILIDLNGRTVIPKLDFKIPDGSITAANLAPEISGFFPVSLSPETGYVWALVDKNFRFALAITSAGKVVGNFDINIPSPEGFKYLIPQINLSYIGDSLIANSTFPAKLTALLSPVRQQYVNAQGGQTSVQAAARTGAINSLVTVENSRIPASGSVEITAITVRLLSTPAFNGGTFTAKGWLRGVYGTLTCVANAGGDLLDDYSFVREVAGTAVYCPANTAFIPDIGERDFWTQIIWIGRNNLDSPETVKFDIEAMVEAQKTSQKRFLILTPPLGGTKTPGQSTSEGVGSTFYNNCVSIEDWAARKYGDKVINVRLLLQQHGDGSADDNDDISKGVVPRSLRGDTVHLLPVADGYLADDCAYILNFKGW